MIAVALQRFRMSLARAEEVGVEVEGNAREEVVAITGPVFVPFDRLDDGGIIKQLGVIHVSSHGAAMYLIRQGILGELLKVLPHGLDDEEEEEEKEKEKEEEEEEEVKEGEKKKEKGKGKKEKEREEDEKEKGKEKEEVKEGEKEKGKGKGKEKEREED
jgi:hypothetical protein